MKKVVMCIVQSRNQAEAIVAQLNTDGFSPGEVSVLFPDRSGTRDFAHEYSTKAPEGPIGGAGVGGVVGGTLGLLAGSGLLAIPGLGPFIAAGPIMASLSGIAAGATVGGIAGALIGMGIPETEARRFEGKVQGGNILLSVHIETSEQKTQVEDIFEAARADDICSVGEPSVPAHGSSRGATA